MCFRMCLEFECMCFLDSIFKIGWLNTNIETCVITKVITRGLAKTYKLFVNFFLLFWKRKNNVAQKMSTRRSSNLCDVSLAKKIIKHETHFLIRQKHFSGKQKSTCGSYFSNKTKNVLWVERKKIDRTKRHFSLAKSISSTFGHMSQFV